MRLSLSIRLVAEHLSTKEGILLKSFFFYHISANRADF